VKRKNQFSMRWARRAAACAVSLGWAAGCVSLPTAPESGQQPWRSQEGQPAKEPEGGWREGRAAPWAADARVALADLIDQALLANPSLGQSWAAARQAEAEMRQAQSPYYPTATVEGRAGLTRSDANSLGREIETTTLTPQGSLAWELLDAGGRRAGLQGAAQRLVAANYEFNQALQDVLLEVQTAYYALHSAQAGMQAAQDNFGAAVKTLEAASSKLEAGLGIELDVLRARTDYEQAQYDLEEARATIFSARGRLAQAVGLPADVPMEIEPPQTAMPTEEEWPEDRVGNLMDEALARRSDVAAIRARVAAAERAVRVASSSLWPKLVAGAQADQTSSEYDAAELEDGDTTTYGGYVALTWTVFDGFLARNEQRAAQAALDAARQAARAAELSAGQDVWNRFYGLRSAIKKFGFAGAALETSEKAYQQADDSYKSGLKDIVYVLDAQSALSSARSLYVAAENEVYVAYVNLIHALGSLEGPGSAE
jgi:outer membrane protein